MKTATVNFCGRRKAQQTRVRCVLTVAVLAISMTVPAQAIVPVLGWGYSVGYGAQYVLGVNGTRSGDGWSGWFDPPANVISGQVTFYYDPVSSRSCRSIVAQRACSRRTRHRRRL
jgi:hypothetical protein